MCPGSDSTETKLTFNQNQAGIRQCQEMPKPLSTCVSKSTESAPRDRCPPNLPAVYLVTADSNLAQPALASLSRRASIALAQAKQAAEAPNVHVTYHY
jgi:hypothetical protein